MNMPAQLRSLVDGPDIVVVPGAPDAVTAKIIQESGFAAVYATGAGFANASYGLPDVGLIGVDAVVEHIRRLVDAVQIPVIVDADTGYGGVLNVARTVRQLERAGASGIQLEDQVSPKRCGHFDGQQVIGEREMVAKLAAAVDARADQNVVLIARTDALATEDFDATVRRANSYAEAGADLVFVEAPQTLGLLRALPEHVKAPLVANMVEGGKTPVVSAGDLQEFGYRIALFANTALRVAMKAVQRAMAELHRTGTTAGLLEEMAGWEERQRLTGLPEFQRQEARYLGLPGDGRK